jgi:hypothetical protein
MPRASSSFVFSPGGAPWDLVIRGLLFGKSFPNYPG